MVFGIMSSAKTMTSKACASFEYGLGYIADLSGASMQASSLIFLAGKVVNCYQEQNSFFCNDIRAVDMEYEKMSAAFNMNKIIMTGWLFGIGLAIRKVGQHAMTRAHRDWRQLPY